MTDRHAGRALAFQLLFELESRPGRALESVLSDRAAAGAEENAPIRDDAQRFALRLAGGTLEKRVEIDARLAVHAPAYPIDQLAVTDRVALELAVYELLYERSAPVAVIINEAVDLAKTFGSETSGRFVNGVLGTIAEELERQAHPSNP